MTSQGLSPIAQFRDFTASRSLLFRYEMARRDRLLFPYGMARRDRSCLSPVIVRSWLVACYCNSVIFQLYGKIYATNRRVYIYLSPEKHQNIVWLCSQTSDLALRAFPWQSRKFPSSSESSESARLICRYTQLPFDHRQRHWQSPPPPPLLVDHHPIFSLHVGVQLIEPPRSPLLLVYA